MAPKKKAVKKAPSVGLRGKKKRVPPAAGLRPKKERPFRLEVGKTYTTASGHTATVERLDKHDEEGLPLKVVWITGRYAKSSFWQADSGKFWDRTMPDLDLVREVVKRRGK